MRRVVIATATTIISVGAVLGAAEAADLYTTRPPPLAAEAPPPAEEAPPPVAEAPPPVEVAPPAVAVIPEAPIVVEPRCPIVWRCGYLGCGLEGRMCAACGRGIRSCSILATRLFLPRVPSPILALFPPALWLGLSPSTLGSMASRVNRRDSPQASKLILVLPAESVSASIANSPSAA